MEKSVKLGIIGLSGQSAFFEVDHFHEPGETLSADSLFMEPGGKGYNQAVAARRLGAEVLYLTCLGRDDFGRQCLDRLGKEGVSPMVKWSEKATAFATILTDAAGDNQITVFAGASGDLTRQDVLDAEEALASCDMLLMQLECPLETVVSALDIAAASASSSPTSTRLPPCLACPSAPPPILWPRPIRPLICPLP